MHAEGWYQDPYELHTDRWFSDGEATVLVRDDGVESDDPAPAEAFSLPLTAAAEQQSPDGSDLLRADDASSQSVNGPMAADASFDAAARSGAGLD